MRLKDFLIIVPGTIVALIIPLPNLAQSTELPVVYKSCRTISDIDGVARVAQSEECGIDEVATNELQALIERSRQPLTTSEEQVVIDVIEKRFIESRTSRYGSATSEAIATILRRIGNWNLSAYGNAAIADVQRIESDLRRYDAEITDGASLERIEEIQMQLKDVARQLNGIIEDRNESSETLLNSVIAGTDELVGKLNTAVDTAIRSGVTPSALLTRRLSTVKQAVADAKRSCSPRRTSGCPAYEPLLDQISDLIPLVCELPGQTC